MAGPWCYDFLIHPPTPAGIDLVLCAMEGAFAGLVRTLGVKDDFCAWLVIEKICDSEGFAILATKEKTSREK